jgi:hypothetical protein
MVFCVLRLLRGSYLLLLFMPLSFEVLYSFCLFLVLFFAFLLADTKKIMFYCRFLHYGLPAHSKAQSREKSKVSLL